MIVSKFTNIGSFFVKAVSDIRRNFATGTITLSKTYTIYNLW